MYIFIKVLEIWRLRIIENCLCMHKCVRVCACVRACVRARVCVCVVCKRACVPEGH